MTTPDERRTLLERWYVRIRLVQAAHYQQSNRLRRRNLLLGVPVAVLSATVGTSVFASIAETNPSLALRIGLGLVSLFIAVLAALQTFLNYPEQSARHREAAVKLSSLKKKVEEGLVLVAPETGEFDLLLKTVRARWDAITREAPLVPEATFQANARQYGSATAFPAAPRPRGESADE